MKSLLVTALLLVPSAALAQTPATYEGTPHGRILACFAQAYSLVELVDVATKNLYLVASEATKESTPARLQVVSGMLASGTLNDQQQALDVVERLEECVNGAIRRAVPDPAAAGAGLLPLCRSRRSIPMRAHPTPRVTSAMGRLMKNIQRQLAWVTMRPPMTGPSVRPR